MSNLDLDDRIGAANVTTDSVRILFVAARVSLIEPVRDALKADDAMQLRLCTEVRDAAGIARAWRPHAVLLDQALAPRIGQRLIERLRAEPATRGAAVIVLADASGERTHTAVARIGADAATPPPTAPALPRALRDAIAARSAESPAAANG